MSQPRKTVDVQQLKERVNRALRDAADFQDSTKGLEGAQAFRQGLAAVLEDVLMASGNYKGFNYVCLENAERDADGYLVPGTYDETKRVYY
jgi:hypothetical protein